MDIFNYLFGSPDKFGQQPTMSPEQQNLLKQIVGQLSGGGALGQGYGQGVGLLQQFLDPNSDIYKNFEKPYMQQFEQQTVPGLAERFAGLGAMGGGLSSSGFGQSLGAAGANLQTQLASMKSNLQRSAISDLFGQYNQLAGMGLGSKPFENYFQPGSYGLLGNALGAFAGGAGSGLGLGFGKSLGQQFF